MKETIQNGKHLLTLEELIDKKTELLFKKTIEVEIESLGGTLVFKQIPLPATAVIGAENLSTNVNNTFIPLANLFNPFQNRRIFFCSHSH